MHELDGHTQLMHRYQESLVGGPSWFENIEIGLYDLVAISNSYFNLHTFTLMIFLACCDFNAHYVKCNVIR